MDSVFTINVGNTHTSLVFWRGGAPVAVQRWVTGNTLASRVKQLLRSQRTTAILAGVVPAYLKTLRAELTKLGVPIKIFRRTLKPRLQIAPRPAARVGDDRIAAALGALHVAPQHAWVIVDAGTAVTVNAVTPKPPRFEGGLIFPGATLGLKALAQSTAQLPALSLNGARKNLIGRSTAEAMTLGVQHAEAFAAAVLALKQQKLLGRQAQIAVTGGRAAAVVSALRELNAARVRHLPNLVHLGLYAACRAADPSRRESSLAQKI